MVVSAPKYGKYGATKFTEDSIVLFFWDGPPRPEVHEQICINACSPQRYPYHIVISRVTIKI